VVLSWSGGKDSSLALAALRKDSNYEVVALLTSITRGYDRVSIHGVRRALIEAQARAVGLPLLEVELEQKSSNEQYEAAFLDALERIRARYPAVKKIAFGDLFLADIRRYRETLTAAGGYESVFPLWGRDTAQLAREFIEWGFRAHLVCVDTKQLDRSFAGREFDDALLRSLPATADPCGENGEFHTFVHDGPIFKDGLRVCKGETTFRDDRFMYCDLTLQDGRGDAPD
jgi:uncharacterized protein (TIGR00290 family)